MAATTDNPGYSRRRQIWLLLMVVVWVAVPIRLYLASNAAMISRDGVRYIWYAQNLRTAPLAEMREQKLSPGYPALILGAHAILEAGSPILPERIAADPVLRWQTAAMAVTLVGGLAVVVAVYLVARHLFDPRTAVVAALMAAAAAEFCQLSADALTDMPHLALYLFALTAAISGMRQGRLYQFAIAGFLSGLAYLLRPEGAEVAVVAAILLVLPMSGWAWRFRLTALAILVVAALLPAAPYMLVTGKLIHKKSLGQMIGGPAAANYPSGDTSGSAEQLLAMGSAQPVRTSATALSVRCNLSRDGRAFPLAVMPMDVLRAIGTVAEHYARSLRVTFLLPALVWIAYQRRKPAEPVAGLFVFAAMTLHLLIVLRLPLAYPEYFSLFSTRHVMILAGLTLPFSAAGVWLCVGFLMRLFSRSAPGPLAATESAPEHPRSALLAALVLVLLIAPTLGYMLEKPHHQSAYLRRAGVWIRAQTTQHPRILTTRHPVAFYADGVSVSGPSVDDIAEMLAHARWQRPDYLVFEERRCRKADPAFFEKLQQNLHQDERLQLVQTVNVQPGEKNERVLIYRYRPGRAAATDERKPL